MNHEILKEQEELERNDVSNREVRHYNEVLDRLILSTYPTKAKFAKEHGFSREVISRIVWGHVEATNNEKIRIAKALKVDSRLIFPEEEQK